MELVFNVTVLSHCVIQEISCLCCTLAFPSLAGAAQHGLHSSQFSTLGDVGYKMFRLLCAVGVAVLMAAVSLGNFLSLEGSTAVLGRGAAGTLALLTGISVPRDAPGAGRGCCRMVWELRMDTEVVLPRPGAELALRQLRRGFYHPDPV